MADIPPSKTIYCQNLYEKIRSVDQMKKCLYAIFSQFGKILDVVVMRSIRLRGQAWVVFEEIGSATSALRAMQGFPFFEKPMRLSYAKSKSDATAKVDGTLKEHLKERRKEYNAAARELHLERAKAKKTGVSVAGGVPQAAQASGEQPPANKILFVQNLPEASTAQMLSMLFQQFPGYVEVRLVDGRPGIAFVEYGNDMQASVALQGLQAFKITPQNSMAITYAKQ
jgi:U2 small nuclear ribonucleoprotein B''